MQPNANRRGLWWSLFAISAATAVALFFIPAWVIQPFKHQAPLALTVAMALRQRAPWGTLLAALVSLGLAFGLWRDRSTSGSVRGVIIWANTVRPNSMRAKWWAKARLWRRIGLALVMVLVIFSAVMARLNYFEWMFHPVPGAQFESEAASKLDTGEMILAVQLGSDARAYPISEMAYHHIVNDVVNGVPICVTY